MWAGEGESLVQGATQVPVVYSAAYGYPDVDEWLDVALGDKAGPHLQPQHQPDGQRLRGEGAGARRRRGGHELRHGHGRVSNTLFALLQPGDRVVSVKDTYGGTNKVFLDFLPRIGVEVDLRDTDDHELIEAAIAEGCRLVYLETPTNPTLKVMDIERLARPPTTWARWWSPTTPSRRPSTRTRWRWAPTS